MFSELQVIVAENSPSESGWKQLHPVSDSNFSHLLS